MILVRAAAASPPGLSLVVFSKTLTANHLDKSTYRKTVLQYYIDGVTQRCILCPDMTLRAIYNSMIVA